MMAHTYICSDALKSHGGDRMTDIETTTPAPRLRCGPDPLPEGMAPSVVMWDLNAATARAFYGNVFGWHITNPGAPPVELAVVESGEGGITGVIGQAPRPGDDDEDVRHTGLIMYIKVPDVATALAAVEANGGRAIWGPTQIAPNFWIAQFEDPDGNRIGLST
jgi:predicted enzyme related to lactoylglutathione lyase